MKISQTASDGLATAASATVVSTFRFAREAL